MHKRHANSRPEVLPDGPMQYAPVNELGVVFLFSHIAKRKRMQIDSIQSGFPDCIAYQKVHGRERKKRIEFEFKSRSFLGHGHDPKKCDCIVCWEHNWPGAPRNIEIIELRREYGLGFNVWIMPTNDPYKEVLAKAGTCDAWSVPSQCHKGDLILYYLTSPEKRIEHVFLATGRAIKRRAGWKPGMDYMGPIRRVCRLKSPIFLGDLQGHRVLSTAPFIRGFMQGRPNATEYWSYLYEMIVRRNPAVRTKLRRFAPDRL